MRTTIWVGLLAVAGCSAEEGATLELLGAGAPNSSCEFTERPDSYLGSGVFDPWTTGLGIGQPMGYIMSVVVNNDVSPTEDYQATVYDENVRPTANSVLLTGFEVCFVLVDEPVETSTYSAGCEDVSEDMAAFIPATIAIGAGNQAPGGIRVLTADHLKQIFGERFSPADIEVRGVVNESVLGKDYNGNGSLNDDVRFLGPEPPDASNRSEAWGTYPPQPETLVLVKIRAVGKTQSGVGVESNWMTFGIRVCVGCFTDRCGALVLTDCGGGVSVWEGSVADWPNTTACFPFQDESPGCAEADGCP